MHEVHKCPTCLRPFTGVMDYPLVRVIEFELLPLPEVVDQMSAAAMRKRSARLREAQLHAPSFGSGGINMTPTIELACNTKAMQDYFSYLRGLVGKEVVGQQLLPTIPAHQYFKWAHPVEDTGIFVSLSEAETDAERDRYAEVQVHCDGPNMGSAGGPTMQPLGAVARLKYQGLLAHNVPA